jgi:hypothetical protein
LFQNFFSKFHQIGGFLQIKRTKRVRKYTFKSVKNIYFFPNECCTFISVVGNSELLIYVHSMFCEYWFQQRIYYIVHAPKFIREKIKIFSFRLAYKEKKRTIFGFKGLKNRSPGVSIS